jgi:pimeloyl-ACP methyl ester carboxylesterase
MSDEEALDHAKDLRPMSLGPLWTATTFAAWRYIPTTFVLCTKDNPATVTGTEMAVKMAQEMGSNQLDMVIRRAVGHSPFYSQPEWTVEMLLAAAKGVSIMDPEQ